MKDDRLCLIHIQEAIERIEENTQDGKEFFLDDHKTQDAVYCVICIPWLSPRNGFQMM